MGWFQPSPSLSWWDEDTEGVVMTETHSEIDETVAPGRRACETCRWWGSRWNVVVSATIRERVQICCNPIAGTGTIVTHARDSCAQHSSPDTTGGTVGG
jgi:hypothetical protein